MTQSQERKTDVLYLQCGHREDYLTVPSLVAVFLQQYCSYSKVSTVLVTARQSLRNPAQGVNGHPQNLPPDLEQEESAHTERRNCRGCVSDGQPDDDEQLKGPLLRDLPKEADKPTNLVQVPECLQDSITRRWEELPCVVQDCQLPCILLRGGQMCISGLANVLRRIVQASAPQEPHRNLLSLLGFRQTCLKSCSESSVWTRLVEVDAPREISSFLENSADGRDFCLPQCLRKFQELLEQPVATFNSEKLRRKLLKNGSIGNNSDGSGSKGNKSKVTNGIVEENINTSRGDVPVDEVGNAGLITGAPVDDLTNGGRQTEPEALISNERGVAFMDEDTNKLESINRTKERGLRDSSVIAPANSSEELHSDFSATLNLVNKKEQRNLKKQLLQRSSQSISVSGNEQTPITDAKSGVAGSTAHQTQNSDIPDLNVVNSGKAKRQKRKQPRKPVPKDSLPNLPHDFALGVDVTLADFALFVPVHLYLHTCKLNGRIQEVCKLMPLVIHWYQRMWTVPHVRRVLRCLKLREVDVSHLNETSSDSTCDKVDDTGAKICPAGEDIQHGVRNLGVSRPIVRELLRKSLPLVIEMLEGKGLGVESAEHPSGETILDWRSFPPAVCPVEGELDAKRAQNKEQQIESIVAAVRDMARPGHRILDFCSGGGHLGIALAYCLPECHVVMIDNKEESLRRALDRVQTLNLENVTIYMSNIDYFCGNFDTGVSLHACGVATDIVLDKCLQQGASFVCSPCCYGSLHDTHHMTYPRSLSFQESSISKRDYFLIGHGAEQTCWDFESFHAKQGKHCMGFIDKDRAELARQHGYDVTVCSLKPAACSPKNNLLIGVSPRMK
ncbi:glutathione S-transferase C-terminal domain-containing protein-like [Diadema antillarum]|uniref:glutathione S-transferase C-terminal domain-containing protein-like n=1 Tax=Diadema antillarum TaxID=105358 RepID=UPI003A86642B